MEHQSVSFFRALSGLEVRLSPLRSGRRKTNVPRTLCDVSRSILHKRVRISPAGSVGAKQVPLAPSAPSRASVVIVLTVSHVGARRFDVSAPVVARPTSPGRCATSRAQYCISGFVSRLPARSAFIFFYKSPTLHNFLCIMET